MFCKNCGAEVAEGQKFCRKCGTKLEGPEYNNTENVAAESVSAQAAAATAAAAATVTAAAQEPTVNIVAQTAQTPQSAQTQYTAQAQPQAADTQYIPPVQPQAADTQYIPPVQPQAEQVYREQPVYQQVQAGAAQAPAGEAKPRKKVKVGLIIGLAAGATVLIALILLFFLLILPIIRDAQKIDIDFRDYIKVEYTGYSSIGNANGDIDTDRFLEDYGEEIKFSRKYKKETEQLGYEPAEMLLNFVYGYVEYDYGQLSNGDEIDFLLYVDTEDIEDIFNVRIVDSEEYDEEGKLVVPLTVEGLEEAELFDPFENIEITVEGFSPFGELEYNFDNGPEPSKENYYAFSVDKSYDLANGDVVTITLDDWYAEDYFLSEYGMLPSKTTYEYTVEGLPELLTSVSQITEENMTYLKTVGDKIYKEEYIDQDDEAITTNSYNLEGVILEVSTSPSQWSSYNNTLYLVYAQNCTVSDSGGVAASESYTMYGVISFNNVMIEDGELSFDESSWTEEYNYFSITVGAWTISSSYGFESIDEIKDKFIDESSSYYTYDTNL